MRCDRPTVERRFFLLGAVGLGVLSTPAVSAARTQPSVRVSAIQKSVEGLVARFMARAGPVLAPYTPPQVTVGFTPQLSWIDVDEKTGAHLQTVAWEQCPADLQAAFAEWVGPLAPMTPEAFFGEVFNAFLIGHEMGHFADIERGVIGDESKRFQSEVYANRIAVAFWLGEPGGRDAWNG